MNKYELIRHLAGETGFSEQEVRLVVDCLLNATIDTLIKGQSLTFHNFGSLRAVWQVERPGRNLRTGEPWLIPARFTVKFRPGKALLEALNRDK